MNLIDEQLLATARTVRRRLRAELTAAIATASREDLGEVEQVTADTIARLQDKLEYLGWMIERREGELGQGWQPTPIKPEYALFEQ